MIFSRSFWHSDFLASWVVTLVALPMCLGVALASGMPALSGIVSGVVGGVLVGALAGSPLQVSGPGSGLIILIWQYTQTLGLPAFFMAVALCGVLQIAASILKVGRMTQAAPPAVVQGVMAGVGIMLLSSQMYILIEEQPRGKPLANLFALPMSLYRDLTLAGSVHQYAAGVGLFTITLFVLWALLARGKWARIPAMLVGISAASVVSWLFDLPIRHVDVSSHIFSDLAFGLSDLSAAFDSRVWSAAATLAVIASAETLLSASAISKIRPDEKTYYNQELLAQGLGNILCGALCALPLNGSIVRSRVNMESGAKTRMAAILHGLWIALAVMLLPFVINFIPVSALAAVMVRSGFDLISASLSKTYKKSGKTDFAIFAATVLAILAFNVVAGLVVGVALSLAKLLYVLTHLKVSVKRQQDGSYQVDLAGAATFVQLPNLIDRLAHVPGTAQVVISLAQVSYIDHACMEHLTAYEIDQHRQGGSCIIEWHARGQYLRSELQSLLPHEPLQQHQPPQW